MPPPTPNLMPRMPTGTLVTPAHRLEIYLIKGACRSDTIVFVIRTFQ